MILLTTLFSLIVYPVDLAFLAKLSTVSPQLSCYFLCLNRLPSISIFPLSCCVPQGSVLGLILLNLYTTPLGTLDFSIFTLSPFFTPMIPSSSFHLFQKVLVTVYQFENTIYSISSWITADLLTLNPSKPEFVLIGRHQQRSKLSNPSLSLPSAPPILPCTSSRNLGFIFDSSLICKTNIQAIQHLLLLYPRPPSYQAYS